MCGRAYHTIFAGPGGIPAADAERVLVTIGVLTALIGAVMCWQQRHVKRLLAYSTVAHTGLFLIGIGLLSHEATGGIAVYIVGHAGPRPPSSPARASSAIVTAASMNTNCTVPRRS